MAESTLPALRVWERLLILTEVTEVYVQITFRTLTHMEIAKPTSPHQTWVRAFSPSANKGPRKVYFGA